MRLANDLGVLGTLGALALPMMMLTGGSGSGQDDPRQDEPARAEPLRLLVVSGEAEVSARPDRAVVHLGATTQAADAAAAQVAVSTVMQRAIAGLREAGIPEQSIQTAQLSLHPVYSDRRHQQGEDPTPRIVGHRASNTVRVQVDELSRIGAVIDAGILAGANELGGISFELRDDEPQRQEALARAVRKARAKAEVLAAAAGVELLSVQHIREGGLDVITPFRADARMALESATPVQPGEIRVSASVTIEYRIGVGGGSGGEEGSAGGR